MSLSRSKTVRHRSSEEAFAAIHERIGSVSSSFAGLEEELINAFSLLVNDGNLWIGMTIADRLNISTTIDLFEDLAQENLNDPEALAQLRDLVLQLRKVNKLRNQVIHSAWLIEAKSGAYSPQPARKRNAGNSPVLDAKDHLNALDNLSAEIDDVTAKLGTFETNYLT